MPCYQHVHLITGLRSLASTGVKAVTIPPQSRANAYAERLALIARAEVATRCLIFGDRHLRSILLSTRPTTTEGTPIAGPSQEPIRRRLVLGGLINEYEQAGQKPWSKAVAGFWHPTGFASELVSVCSQAYVGAAARIAASPGSHPAAGLPRPSAFQV